MFVHDQQLRKKSASNSNSSFNQMTLWSGVKLLKGLFYYSLPREINKQRFCGKVEKFLNRKMKLKITCLFFLFDYEPYSMYQSKHDFKPALERYMTDQKGRF